MPKSLSTLTDECEVLLNDSGNVIFAAATVNQHILKGLWDASQFLPYVVRDGLITTASRTLDTSGIVNLIGVDFVEYKVDQYPKQFHNVVDLADGVLEMKRACVPTAGEDLYLYCEKTHTLCDPPSSLTGTVNNNPGPYAVGATSIVLDALGTGTIKAGTLVSFTGIIGQYKVSADVAIVANAATIVLTSGIREALPDNTVVTFRCSTLTTELEDVIPELGAGYCLAVWDGTSVSGGSSGRQAVKDAFTLAGEANTFMDTVDEQIGLAVANLSTGSANVNKVTVGAGFREYQAWANSNLQNSAAIIRNAQPFLSEAQVRLGINNIIQAHRNAGFSMIQSARAKLKAMARPRTRKMYSEY